MNDTKQVILIEAKKLFARYGYEKTSISQIAKAAGGTKSLIYHYFNSKEELLSEVLKVGTDAIYRIHFGMADGKEEELTLSYMREIMEACFGALKDQEDVLRIMLHEFVKGTHPDNTLFTFAENFTNYIEQRGMKHFPHELEERLKFMIQFFYFGGIPLHMFMVSSNYFSEKLDIEKEVLWKIFKSMYIKSYLEPMADLIHVDTKS